MLPPGVAHHATPGGLDFNKLPRIASAKFVFEDGTRVGSDWGRMGSDGVSRVNVN